MRVVVFGATGFIGRALLPALAAEQEVVAVSRSPQPPQKGITWVVGDVTDAPAVRRALDGADVVYYLVHSLGSPDFEERDVAGARTTAAEAETAGARQIVYLGGLGEEGEELSPHLGAGSRPDAHSHPAPCR